MDAGKATFDAITLPADDRLPYIVPLMASPLGLSTGLGEPTYCGRIPHPEEYMDYIADQYGSQAWSFHLIDTLDGMLNKLAMPYVLFYPIISRDGMPFPFNRLIREIQGDRYDRTRAWCGDLVVAKYKADYSAMTDASMADFPIIKNYLSTHPAPVVECSAPVSQQSPFAAQGGA